MRSKSREVQLPEADSTGDWNGLFCLLSELLLLLPSSSAGGPIAVVEEEVADEIVVNQDDKKGDGLNAGMVGN